MSPANGEEAHWSLGGYIEPMWVTVAIQVCEEHNATTHEEVQSLDLG